MVIFHSYVSLPEGNYGHVWIDRSSPKFSPALQRSPAAKSGRVLSQAFREWGIQ